MLNPISDKMVGAFEDAIRETERQDSCEDYILASLIYYRESKMRFPIMIEEVLYLFDEDSVFLIGNNRQLIVLDTTNICEIDTTKIIVPKKCYTVFDSISLSSLNADSVDVYLERTINTDSIEKNIFKTQRLVFAADTFIEMRTITHEIINMHSGLKITMD